MKGLLINISRLVVVVLLTELLVASLAIYVFSTQAALLVISKDSAADLRNRVTGVRVALSKQDPYFFKWDNKMPDTLADPYDSPEDNISRLTVTPSVLLTHVPFANMHYINTLFIWLGLLLVVYLLVIYLLVGMSKSRIKKMLIFCMLLSLTFSASWIPNVSAGQLYFIYTLIALVSVKGYLRDSKLIRVLAIFVLGVLLSFRPQYVGVLLVLFAYKKNYKLLPIAFFGLLISVAASTARFGASSWFNYFKAMTLHSSEAFQKVFRPYIFNDHYPKSTEGLIMTGRVHQFYDSSLKGVLLRLFNYEVSSLILLAIGITGLLLIFLWLLKTKKLNGPLVISISFLITMFLEIITPAPRYNYYNIIMYPVIIMILFFYKSISLRQKILLALFFYLGNLLSAYDNPVRIIFVFMFILVSSLYTLREVKCLNHERVRNR